MTRHSENAWVRQMLAERARRESDAADIAAAIEMIENA